MAKNRTTRKKLRTDSSFVTGRRFNDAANPPKSDTSLGAGKEESALPQTLSVLDGFAGLPFSRLTRRELPSALPEVVEPLPNFFLESSAFRFRNLFCPLEQ